MNFLVTDDDDNSVVSKTSKLSVFISSDVLLFNVDFTICLSTGNASFGASNSLNCKTGLWMVL